MNSEILKNVLCGNIIIDKYLDIRAVDYDYSSFVGESRLGNLAKAAHPEDLTRLKEKVLSLKRNEAIQIGYRVLAADDNYHNVTAKFFYADEKAYEIGSVHAQFIDVDLIAEAFFSNLSYISKLESYLEMTESILFEYDKYADRLIFYIGSIRNNRLLFDGSVELWTDVCKRLPMIEQDKDVLNEINNFLLLDRGQIYKRLRFTDNAKEIMPTLPDYFCGKVVSVKAKHTGQGENSKVLGYMFAGQGEQYVPDETKEKHMDAALNIYDKETITYYARKQIEAGKKGLIAVLDVDNFKNVNDTYGHMFGDEVLVEVASIIKSNIAGKGVVGRIGGDEFMIVIDKYSDEGDIRGIFSSIRSIVKYTFAEKDDGYNITVSIGIAEYGNEFKNYDDVFKVADAMLYRAKQKGRNRYIIYNTDIHGDVLANDEKLSLNNKNDINGLSKDEFMLRFFEEFRSEKTLSLNDALELESKVFKLDEILIYKEKLDKPKYGYSRGKNNSIRDGGFINEEEFKRYFNGNGVAVIQHANNFRDVCQPTYDFMTLCDYESMIVYRGKSDNFYVVYGKCDKKARKWEETDVSYLNFLGALMEMEIK